MKLYNKFFLLALGATMTVSCSDIDEQEPQGGSITGEQLQEINSELTERAAATFNGMFSMMGQPYYTFGESSGRADDFGYVMSAISLDAEGADFVMADNGYNWFSPCCEYTSRNANYANPYIRYKTPYAQIGICNDVLNSFPEDTENEDALNMMAQARAMRAFAYMALAPYFQFGYSSAADKPCVPILSAGVDYTNNPRATVAEVYDYIIADLDWAIEHLTSDRTTKDKININVAYGLRARAYLAIEKYAEAAADAEKAMEGYTPASIAEVSIPAFCSLDEHNWIWGIDITDDMGQGGTMATASSWISAFSGNGYAAATSNTPMINVLLYNKIPDTDVRKGWWLDENKHTPNWADLTWNNAKGDEIADLTITDVKNAFEPYTNVKFGMPSDVGSTMNNSDWPLMRVEEMILIQAEGLAKSGNESRARQILEDFVKTYRDPSYSSTAGGRSLADEIWFQRRVELWGEGFFTSDAKRLGKPIVRFHQGEDSNVPDNFQMNLAADDGWLNMRFPQTEMDNNQGIVDNTDGSQPVAGQNGSLRDGVTD